MDDMIEGVDLGRQLSRATCWASSVAAIGQMACPERRTNAAALVVAEASHPTFETMILRLARPTRPPGMPTVPRIS